MPPQKKHKSSERRLPVTPPRRVYEKNNILAGLQKQIMNAYCQSEECRNGSVAALQGVLTSACSFSQLEMSYLLRINAGFNYVDCVRLLLQSNADPSLQTRTLCPSNNGQRASTCHNSLHEACLCGASADVVSLLLEYEPSSPTIPTAAKAMPCRLPVTPPRRPYGNNVSFQLPNTVLLPRRRAFEPQVYPICS